MKSKVKISFGATGLFDLSKELLKSKTSSIFILVDSNTKKFCLSNFISQTKITNYELIEMHAGEEFKNIKTCEMIWHKLTEKGADRNSILINLGGGVVCDLGGFVACTFKRGIDFYNIPTTLLSMVDASVGGKTGIDLGSLKNQIGIFKEPKEVIIDSNWLKTLPKEEIRSGFAEMLKHGLIASASYWDKLKKINLLSISNLSKHIMPSITIKKRIVLNDYKEKNLRKILNFGHTFGHAIESYFLEHKDKKRLLHGEAISIGMILEAYISTQVCGFHFDKALDIKKTFNKYFPKVMFKSEEKKFIISLLSHDKKNDRGKINFVLLKDISKPVIDVNIEAKLLNNAFDFYES